MINSPHRHIVFRVAFVYILSTFAFSASTLSAESKAAAPTEAASAGAFDPDQVVATIGSRQLTLGELMVRYATLPQSTRLGYGGRLDHFLRDTVGNLVVVDRARQLGVAEDPLFSILLEIRREEILRDLYARRTVLAEIDDATIERRYAEHLPARFNRRERIRLRHILITPAAEQEPFNSLGADAVGQDAAQQKAVAIEARLAAGGDFAELAREVSEDASAPDGGDLGWMSPLDLLPALAKAAIGLKVGERSGIIESSVGFHLIELIDRREGGQVSLALIRELLYQEVVGEQAGRYAQNATEDRARLIAEAKVEIFPERLPW